MPELPRFYSTKNLPSESALVPMSPGLAGMEAEALERSGARLEQLGRVGWELSRKIEEASEAEKILNINYRMKDDFRGTAEKFRERRDYDNFDDDIDKELERIRKTHGENLTSHSMRMAFDQSFMSMSSNLKDALLHKKIGIITENALGAFNRTYDEAISEYIGTNDENARKAIKNNLELEAEVLVSRNIMNPVEADKLLSTFDSQAEESQVRNIGLVDPLKAYGLLMDKTVLTNIDPIKRAQLAEHMETRVRMEEGRQDKLSNAIQRENQANALNDFAYGKLDFDKLMMYRGRDDETGMPGLSDAFFSSMLEKVRKGKDVVTDPKVFADLYLDENLTRRKIDQDSGSLSTQDQRTLLSRILQEGREDERDSKALRREKEAEGRREISEERREAKERERAEKERRNHYTSDARSYMKKAFNEFDIEAEEGGKMLRAFQGYVDDPKIPPEELVEYAQKIMETRKGGIVRQFWNWMFPDKAKALPEPPPTPVERKEKTAVTPGVAGPRKSLDDIFGGKKPIPTPPPPVM